MFNNKWDYILEDILKDEEFINFYKYILLEYEKFSIYPPKDKLFKALEITDYDDVKVVILGQDPYHQFGQANGLAFSVNKNVKIPPSLKNIFKEIKRDLNIENNTGDLTHWANQGVLLLNTVLTVKDSIPKSYSNTYWEKFTDIIISKISDKGNVIFLLWGNDAIKKSKLISNKNYILSTTHPSPLSAYRGFNGSGHFSKVNKLLLEMGKETIDWSVK